MGHEPSRFRRHAQDAMEFIAANALLAVAQEMRRLKPNMKIDMASLENGPLADRELTLAVIALPQAVHGAPIGVFLACFRSLNG